MLFETVKTSKFEKSQFSSFHVSPQQGRSWLIFSMTVSGDEPGEDSPGGRGVSEEDSEDASDEEGAVGNTEGEDIPMSAAEAREARGKHS